MNYEEPHDKFHFACNKRATQLTELWSFDGNFLKISKGSKYNCLIVIGLTLDEPF